MNPYRPEPKPEWVLDYHASEASNVDIFEAVREGRLTARDGAEIMARRSERRYPRWIRRFLQWAWPHKGDPK